jgi:hypothetical protein
MTNVVPSFSAFLFITGALAAQTMPGIIAAGTETQPVKKGFRFTEGPVGTADGGRWC